jgi:uncharacterized SAM-binding protein YcdF (DUF218 family)
VFTLTKLVKPFLLPPGIFIIGLMWALVLHMRKRHRWGNLLIAFLVFCLYALSTEPVSQMMAISLYPRACLSPDLQEMAGADAIVILAGGSSKADGIRPKAELSGSSWRRLWHAIELYKALGGKVPILYIGGSGDPFDPVSVEAGLARKIATSVGVSPDHFWIEEQSRDTYENALAVAETLSRRLGKARGLRVVLVTSVLHIVRAVGVMGGWD